MWDLPRDCQRQISGGIVTLHTVIKHISWHWLDSIPGVNDDFLYWLIGHETNPLVPCLLGFSNDSSRIFFHYAYEMYKFVYVRLLFVHGYQTQLKAD